MSHLERLLRDANAALRTGDIHSALRLTDRARRRAPQSGIIADLYGRSLILSGDLAAGIRWLFHAVQLTPAPDIEASLINALITEGRNEDADLRAKMALQRFAIEPEGQLAASLTRLVSLAPPLARGWVGLTPELGIVGHVVDGANHPTMMITCANGRMRQQPILLESDESRFHLPHPDDANESATTYDIVVAGVPLLGSPLIWPPRYDFDGRVTCDRDRIHGWVRLGWLPNRTLDVIIEDTCGRHVLVGTRRDLHAEGRHAFSFSLAESTLEGSRLKVSAVLPDGHQETFPDSPLLRTVEASTLMVPAGDGQRTSAGKPRRPERNTKHDVPPLIDILVPVYLGYEETMACLQAVIDSRRSDCEVVVIDDASPDPLLTTAMDRLAAARSITLLRNDINRGFPGSINRGLTLHPERDVIVLNADAIVHGDWIDRLQRAAYSSNDIGTATPLSNRGSIASYPGGDESDIGTEDAATIDALTASIHSSAVVDLPVGVGFCLYMRRACINEVGLLDSETFGKGYGEENDFCLRARQHGWRHVLAADVFVRHHGSRSFGARRNALVERNTRLLNLRYPGYEAQIASFIKANGLASIRRRLDEARLIGQSQRWAILVSHALTGGVDRFITKRCHVLQRAGLKTLILRPVNADIDGTDPESCQLTVQGGEFRDLEYATPRELPALRAFFAQLQLSHAEIHHFLGFHSQVIEAIVGLPIPFDTYIHDYSWLCPRITLLSGSNRYCGEPTDVVTCEACITRHGSSLHEAIPVAELRQRSSRWLATARRVFVPTNDVASRMERYFPRLPVRIRPWERGVVRGAADLPPVGLIRVALIGAIGAQKGFDVVRTCAEDARARQLPLEFVVLGYTEDDDALLATGKAFATGRYDEPEIGELLRRERPHLTFFPSVTPETWCFALSHALRYGAPIIAFDLGTIAERLRACGVGAECLIPDDASPSAINDHLIAMGTWAWQIDQPQWVSPQSSALTERVTSAQSIPNVKFGMEGGAGMQRKPESTSQSRKGTLTSSAEVITLPQGLYIFRVNVASPVRTATGAENITVPAVHIGPAPGISPDQVSFISGPHTKGTWLCEPGNMIVCKVASGSAPLIMTSIRSVGGEPLAIEVERLDARETDEEENEGRLPTAQPAAQSSAPSRFPLPPQGAQARLSPGVPPRNQQPPQPAPTFTNGIRIEILTHIQNRGDVIFVDANWAGAVNDGLWIESFSLKPLEQLAVDDIEYKSLTVGGFETPWIIGGNSCGTQGMSAPLMAFAVRLKRKPGVLVFHDCEYSGYFASGAVVGPVKNGTPCRSSTANDPLIGMRVHFVPRHAPAIRPPELFRAPTSATGPRFAKLREAADRAEMPVSSPDIVDSAMSAPRDRDDRSQSSTSISSAGDATVTGTTAPADTAVADKIGETTIGRAEFSTDESEITPAAAFGPDAQSRSALMKRILPFFSA